MMGMNILIREEARDDIAWIYALTAEAFAPMPFAAGDEQDLIDALRANAALQLSLVAEVDGQIIGHAALSRASHESGEADWFALGPISVAPAWQGRGIGGELIDRVKIWLEEQNARGCILTGAPEYYLRHGFLPAPQNAPLREPSEYFMVWPRGETPAGRFEFHPLFYP